MGMSNKQKDNLRRVIRVSMIGIAVVFLVVALVIPVANNFIAAGVCKDLEALPLPADTTVVETASAAGKLTGNGNGMQYFGALLLQSSLTAEELRAHYAPHFDDSLAYGLEPQNGAAIRPAGNDLPGDAKLTFSASAEGEGWYILYHWGSAPEGLRWLLDLDMRGH